MFTLSAEPLQPEAYRTSLESVDAGAWVTFEGHVRRENEGRPVSRLHYDAYAEVAEKEGTRIVEEAVERFNLIAARAIHRSGTLAVGDVAVWIGVCAGHRGEAFEACRYIIDEIKKHVPIWKKEEYADGDSTWLEGSGADEAS